MAKKMDLGEGTMKDIRMFAAELAVRLVEARPNGVIATEEEKRKDALEHAKAFEEFILKPIP